MMTNTVWTHGEPLTSTVRRKLYRHETGVYGTLTCGHYTIIAECGGHTCNSETLREDQKAHARLIAASPLLLSAARLARDFLNEDYTDGYELLKRLETAIAQAEEEAE